MYILTRDGRKDGSDSHVIPLSDLFLGLWDTSTSRPDGVVATPSVNDVPAPSDRYVVVVLSIPKKIVNRGPDT